MICNLAIDTPQIALSIYPYVFLTFVKTGIQDHYGFAIPGESFVFFLVKHILTGDVRLMYYRTMPW